MILGIDPGAKGGIASVCEHGKFDPIAVTMPELERGIWDALKAFSTWCSAAYLEEVWALPIASRQSSFRFGQSYGFLRACLIGLEIPFEEVLPKAWQSPFGLARERPGESKTKKKRRHVAKAQQMFPQVPMKATDDGIADALLIAEYGRRLRAGAENV